MARRRDIQPWLDYFGMLQEYERKGYLEVLPEKGEAYVTQTALHAMSPGDDPLLQLGRAIPDTLRRIRVYAVWKTRSGKDVLDRIFALHVVGDDEPHDLLYTLLLHRRRAWWKLWLHADRIEMISYK